ncbi:beta-glucosidase family protein [Halococcoides cellulosivorans]|uniref:Glycosyl hydrolase n=1 Tax=Halococcoides cellulosivorans TaxID=1679096 RepID=A0A2R4X4K2_9EURY|nr:glycoside hydrolase family 3 C-terminal domain-containing protein [Halococcoides cellulosivorans]AWB28724.1 glycosyl hydrolase [Halococcoides cellulosivorans]
MSNTNLPSDSIETLLDRLTIDEKLRLIRGGVDPDARATGYVPGIDRLEIPALALVDGPMGVRAGTATGFPASIALAASWDPDLARELGRALGIEAREKGQDVVLAPGMNLLRAPQCGRAFEYYSEDPTLTSRLAVGTIEGIQSAGAIATAKHFVANSQEERRFQVDHRIDERPLRELYLRAFEASVREADAGMVMAAYNGVNGDPMTANERLLTDVLREEWGFEGVVVSDWWAVTDGPRAITAGLDLEMPGVPVNEWHLAESNSITRLIDAIPDHDRVPRQRLARLLMTPWLPDHANPNLFDAGHFDGPLREALDAGRLDERVIDRSVQRLLETMDRFGVLDGDRPDPEAGDHDALARRIARRGTVLLENDEVLPLDDPDSIVMIGPNVDRAKVGGGGSSAVEAGATTDPVRGVRDRVGAGTRVHVERGHEPFETATMGASPFEGLEFGSEDSDGRIDDAVAAAGDADVAVVVVQDNATEGEDRPLWLPGEQDQLVSRVATAAEQCVVVVRSAGPIAMPWATSVDAILAQWYPGQADGRALADVLFGDHDPGGRLPATFGRRPDDYPATDPAAYPGIDDVVSHEEGLSIGYRYFEAEDVQPLYPFGHGESYAEFAYGAVSVDGGTVEVSIENTSERAGREVVQVYLDPVEPSVERPPRELAGFAAIELAAGESRTVEVDLPERAGAVYDPAAGAWAWPDTDFEAVVGRSVTDERGRTAVSLGE